MTAATILPMLAMAAGIAPGGTEPAGAGLDFDPALTITLRVALPLSSWFLWAPADGGVSLFGLSVAGRFARLAEVEAGYGQTVNPCVRGDHFTVRAGVAPSLLRARPEGTHWNLRLPALLGYHAIPAKGGGCDQNPDKDIQMLMASTGLDATYWTRTRLGIDLRLLLGIGEGWSEVEGHGRSGRALEASLTVGFSFR
jgi:hypothetical protein